MRVTKNIVVSIRHIMKNSRGEVLEDNMNAKPASYLHGSSGIHHLLQAQLEGLKEGDTRRIHVNSESGLTDDDITFDIVIDKLREASQGELILGYPILSGDERCDEDCICYK